MQLQAEVARPRPEVRQIGAEGRPHEPFGIQAEMDGDTTSELQAGQSFSAGPMIDPGQVSALAKLDGDVGEIRDGDGLADFVGEQRRRPAGPPLKEKTLVQATISGGRITAEQGRTDDGSVLASVLQHLDFARGLGFSVDMERTRSIRVLIAAVFPVEDHVGRQVNELGADVKAELREPSRQGDIEQPGFVRQARTGRDRREPGAIDHGLGKFLEQQSLQPGFVPKVDDERTGGAGQHRRTCAAQGQDLVSAALRGQDDLPPQEPRSTGDDDFHAQAIIPSRRSWQEGRMFGSRLPIRPPRALFPSAMASYSDLANRPILAQPVYEAGRPIEVVAREFGLDPSAVIKLASNENPLGPSPLGLVAARKALDSCHLYPDGGCTFLREKLARKWGMEPGNFVIGNGSNEVMILLAQAFLRPGDEVVFGSQAFIVYKLATMLFGATPIEVPMPGFRHDLEAMRRAVGPKTRIVFLASPNNPTGGTDEPAEILRLAESLPDNVIFCLDEAYAEYLDATADLRPLMRAGRKVVLTRTFSKAYGLAGLRVGYLMGSAEVCGLLNRVRQPFNVNLPALAAAEAALDDEAFVRRTVEVNAAGLRQLGDGLRALGFEYIEGRANFLAARIPDAEQVFTRLQRAGVIVRPLRGYGMTGWLRLTVGTSAQNERLLGELARL